MKNIITKFIADTITDEELKALHEWLENTDNQKKFERYISDYHDLNLYMLKNDIDKAYKNVKYVIDGKQKIIPIYRRKFFGYAAAILVLISSTFFFLTKNTLVENNTVSINPGTDKAILTLSNGSEVFLDSVTNYQDKMIFSSGKEIRYSKVNEKNTGEEEYNYLTIPRGGQYHIVLSDGTGVWVNSESQLKYPVNFVDDKPREVELVYGEAYFEVSPSYKNNGAKFFVLNKNQTIEVIGTKFNVKAYKEEFNVYTTLIEGKVSVSSKLETALLIPNKQSVLSIKNQNLDIKEIDVKNEIAWIRGEFIFQKKTLRDIAKVLGRWYDVDFEFLNESIAEQKFNGELKKNQNLETILKLIKNTNKIESYDIKGTSILLK